MLSNYIAWFTHRVVEPEVLEKLYVLKRYEQKSLDEKIHDQIVKFKNIAQYAYSYNKYYKRIFDNHGIDIEQIRYYEDIEKIPSTTKQDMVDHYEDFIANPPPYPYMNNHTSGTSGFFFHYRIDKSALYFGKAKLLRGWGYGGYTIGDKMATISPSKESFLKRMAMKYLLARVNIPVAEMSDSSIQKKIELLNQWKPLYVRGYVSSILLISDYIIKNKIVLKFTPKNIFTTAEKLHENQRKLISEAFKADVFDTYGLYDCGITAFECEYHNGLHIDYENSLFEIVNEHGNGIYEQEGKIIGTDFYNYSFPFIRYDTGDYGILSKKECSCGRTSDRVMSILGRETDHLELHGTRIRIAHNFMYNCNVKQFQVHQTDSHTVKFLIVKLPTYTEKHEKMIIQSILSKVDHVTVHVEYVDTILPYQGNKFKIIVRHNNDG